MPTPFAVTFKSPSEVLDYTIDWSDTLDSTQTISSSSWTVPSGLQQGATGSDTETTTIRLSGGTADETYDVTNEVTISDGEVFVRVLRIVVGPMVTSGEVRQLVSTSTTDLSPYIIAAYRVVEDNIPANALPDMTRKEVMRWIAAHFVSMEPMSEGRVVEQEVLDARSRFVGMEQNIYSVGLGSTRYGQQAMVLDTTHTLSKLGKRKATFKAVNFKVK